ncbi:TPA: hypothetical protein ACUUA6_006438 [Pseudomonas aeruginosa]
MILLQYFLAMILSSFQTEPVFTSALFLGVLAVALFVMFLLDRLFCRGGSN